VTPDNSPVSVGLSLGVATYPDDAQSMGQLIEVADARPLTGTGQVRSHRSRYPEYA
jgi:hypothetical protein